MKKFDFIGQTALLTAALVLLLAFGMREGLVLVALIQFFIGCWQIISAIVFSVSASGNSRRKKCALIYWGLVATYALGFGILAFYHFAVLFKVWFFSAWLIAIYYYILTFLEVFRKTAKKSFLDIAN